MFIITVTLIALGLAKFINTEFKNNSTWVSWNKCKTKVPVYKESN